MSRKRKDKKCDKCPEPTFAIAPKPKDERSVRVTATIPLDQILQWEPEYLMKDLGRNAYNAALRKIIAGDIIRG
jgi:hypothetical protein